MLSAQPPAYSLHTRVEVAERLLIAGLRALDRVDEAEAAQARLAFLFEASQELARNLQPAAVLQTIPDLVVPELADSATLYICEADGSVSQTTSATSAAIADRTQEWWSWFERVTTQVLERAISFGVSQHASASDKQSRNTLFAYSQVSYLVVPVYAQGRRVGALRMVSFAPRRAYGGDDVRLAEAFAGEAGLALENASLYDKQLALVAHLEEVRGQLDAAQAESLRDDERRRIARDLHDQVEQIFFAIGLTATAALNTRQHDPMATDLADALQHVSQLSASGAEHLRGAIFALRHADFTTFGLVSSLRRAVEVFQQRTGIETDLVVTGTESEMPGQVTETLHAVVHEALSNIERHARATSVVVKLQLRPTSVTLTMHDDGVGAPPLVLERLGSSALRFGLAGLRERVRRINGSFGAGLGANGGFVVRARFPLARKIVSA